MTRFAFRFSAVDLVREVVRTQHPHVEEMSESIQDDLVQQLIERVRKTSMDEIPSLSKSLNRAERGAAVIAFGISKGGDVPKKLERLLKAVPRQEYVRSGWTMTVHHCGKPRYLSVMRDVARAVDHAFPQARDGRHGAMLKRLAAKNLYDEVLAQVEGEQLVLDAWLTAEKKRGASVPPDSELARRLRLRLLTAGTAALIRRHEVKTVQEWAKQFRENEYSDFAVHYLVTLSHKDWAAKIINDLVQRYKLPAAGNPFWDRVPEEVRLAIQRMVAARLLKQFFSDLYDPEERFGFWREFLDHFTDIQFPISREHVFLAFGSFGVVEFRDMGNAAYFYRQTHFPWLFKRIASPSVFLKDKGKCFRRLIHFQGWQDGMRGQMHELLGRRKRK